MRKRHILLLTSLACAVFAAPTGAQGLFPDPLGAWERVPPTYPAFRPWSGRTTVEGFYSRYRFDGRGDSRVNADGLGGRLLWQPASAFEAGDRSLASRLALGAFAVYTPEQGLGFTTLHTGAEADLRLLATSLFGRVDPVASLGAGVFRARPADGSTAASTPFPLAERTSTSFALSPALGARVGLGAGTGLRADVRDVMTFRGDTRHNVELSAGLSVSF